MMCTEDVDCWNHVMRRGFPPGIKGAVHYINILRADKKDGYLMVAFMEVRRVQRGFYSDDEWIDFSGPGLLRLLEQH